MSNDKATETPQADPAVGPRLDRGVRPLATMSLCCRMIRIGHCEPSAVHDGTCRSWHGGELGPTITLCDISALISLQLAAARHMAAAALLHGSPHDRVAIRAYAGARATLRDVLPDDDEEA